MIKNYQFMSYLYGIILLVSSFQLSLPSSKEDPEPTVIYTHGDEVRSVRFSPDNTKIISGAKDNKLTVWDVSAHKIIYQYDVKDWIMSLCFSLDGKTIVGGSQDRNLHFWNVLGNNIRKTGMITDAHALPIRVVLFSPDGKWIASGGADKEIKLWQLDGINIPKDPTKTLTGHSSDITCLAFSPDNTYLVSGCATKSQDSNPKTLILWNIKTGEKIHDFKGYKEYVNSVAFSPDGKNILTGSGKNALTLWNRDEGIVKKQYIGHVQYVRAVLFLGNDKIVSTSYDKTIKIWNKNTGEMMYNSPLPEISKSISVSHDQKQLLISMGKSVATLTIN